jgi:hypothetical protein
MITSRYPVPVYGQFEYGHQPRNQQLQHEYLSPLEQRSLVCILKHTCEKV